MFHSMSDQINIFHHTLKMGILFENGDPILMLLRHVFHSQIKIKTVLKSPPPPLYSIPICKKNCRNLYHIFVTGIVACLGAKRLIPRGRNRGMIKPN